MLPVSTSRLLTATTTLILGCAALLSARKVPLALTVQLSGITNTQAVLDYIAPDSSPCQVQVSSSPSFSPLAYDVDPNLFPGSNLDNRAQLGNDMHRVFVIGARVAQIASDKKYYSRALQANTTYYFNLTCSNSGAHVSGSFITKTVALGNTFADPLPADPTQPGEYAWPTLSMSDRTQQIIDPQTGVLIRRVSLPEDRDLTTSNAAFSFVRTSGWSNGAAALSSDDGGQAATITGDSQSPLLLMPQNAVTNYGYINSFSGTHTNNSSTLNWFQVVLNAKTSNVNCATSPGADCSIAVCLTIDGVNCNPNGQTFVQSLTPTLTNYTFGTSGTAIDLWQNAGKRPFNGTEIAFRQGSVNCDGSSTVTWAGGDYFATFWTAGSVMTINGQDYPIQQVLTTQALQLSTACPSTNGQPLPYTATNFGVIVRKATSSQDTVSVEYVSANYQNGVFPYFDFTGEYDLCGIQTVTGPTGNLGYNCSLYQNGPVYWVDGSTGESHLIALNQGDFSSTYTGACGLFDSIIFDPKSPDTWYCGGPYPQKVQYFGNHSDPKSTTYPGYLEEQVNIPQCNSSSSPTNQPCLVFTGLTGSTTIGTLAQSFDSTFDPVAYGNPYLSHVENGLLVYRFWRSNYGSLGWTVLFDPNATANGQANNAGCVGNGAPGCVVGAISSWKSPAARWCALKSNDPMNIPGWSALGSFGWGPPGSGIPGMGPYLSTVNDGTSFSDVVGAPGGPSGPGNCAPNGLGVTEGCTTVHVDGQPYTASPCNSSPSNCWGEIETGAPGEIGNAQPGDFFMLSNFEVMRLIAIDPDDSTKWTFQRAYNSLTGTSGPNPQLVTFCNANADPANVNGSGEWYWNYTLDPHGLDPASTTTITDPNGVNAHFFIQNGSMVNGYTLDPSCGTGASVCYQNRLFTSIPEMVTEGPTSVQTTNPAFNGITPASYGNWVQSHSSGPGWNSASSPNAGFFLDGRPFNGGPLSGSATANGSNPATPVTGSLWKFTAASIPQLHRKLNATFAFSGSKTLIDVSSPAQGNVISGSPADNYKYCVANVPGECISGSQVGDVYINAPYVAYPYCNYPSQASSMPDEYDLCIGDNGMIYNSLTQMNGMVTDTTGASERMLSKGLSRARITDAFWHVHALPNTDWIYFKTSYAENVGDMVFALQLPPPTMDSVQRTQFEPTTVKTPTVPSGTATAYVEFGYGEYGAPGNLYCTSRAEVCAATNATSSIDLNAPFFFGQTEAASIHPIACSSSCTVVIPTLPQHVVFYRFVYLDGAGAMLARSGTYAIATN